jgi:hypothetical protein
MPALSLLAALLFSSGDALATASPPRAPFSPPIWVEHDLGWATVRVPSGWIAVSRCGPEVPDNPGCGCALSAAEFQDGDGAFLVVALDRDGCSGGSGAWELALAPTGDRVRVVDSPAPGCFAVDGVVDEDEADCAEPTVLVTAATVAAGHGYTFQFGHDAGRDRFDAELFRKIIESARLAPRWAVAAALER